jgi:UDP-glucose 4-epimerase
MMKTDGKCIALIGVGFIGKHLVRRLLSNGHSLRVLDRNVCPLEFGDKLHWLQGDCHDRVALDEILAGAEMAYHLVSSTVPGDFHVDVARELHENVVGSLGVIDACIKNEVQRLVYVSSASVYGVQDHFPVKEGAPTWPISVHGIHKLAVEKFLWLAHREHGLEVRIVRLANPYGPGQSITGRQGFVAIAIGCHLRGETLILREGGRMIRDFIFIEDAAFALAEVGVRNGLPLVLNIGAGEGYSLLEVVNLIEHFTQRKVKVANAPPRQIDIPVSVLDVTLANKVIGFTPKTSLRSGIGLTLESIANEVGIELCSSIVKSGEARC